MMKRLYAFLFLLPILISCKNQDKSAQKLLSGNIEFSKSWAHPTTPTSNSTAYLIIYNGTNRADSLFSISSESFQKAQVHESYQTQDGLSGMRPVENLSIASGDSLVLRPGGMHAMLMGAKKTFVNQDSIEISFRFKHAADTTIKVPIQSINQE